jgi:hypothetical protein
VASLPPRIDGLSARLEATAQAEDRYLAAVAIKELESQKQRLASYSLQARFALASIYDKAATSSSNSNDAGNEGGGDKGGSQ